jgi:hypothetical protein
MFDLTDISDDPTPADGCPNFNQQHVVVRLTNFNENLVCVKDTHPRAAYQRTSAIL